MKTWRAAPMDRIDNRGAAIRLMRIDAANAAGLRVAREDPGAAMLISHLGRAFGAGATRLRRNSPTNSPRTRRGRADPRCLCEASIKPTGHPDAGQWGSANYRAEDGRLTRISFIYVICNGQTR